MLTEPLPIPIFIRLRFQDPQVSSITEKWRVEREQIEDILINHFNEMGIFCVEPRLEETCFRKIVEWLTTSPAIWQVVKKAEDEENRRRANRREH